MIVMKSISSAIDFRNCILSGFRVRYAIVAALLAVTFSSGCGSDNKEKIDSSHLTVGVSILPQKWFVDQISGGTVVVEVLVPAGRSPATYEPSPAQMTRFSAAPVFFAVGVPYERSVLPRLSRALPNLEIVSTTAGLQKRPLESSHSNEIGSYADHHHSTGDPHTWLDPALARHQCAVITEELVRVDPINADLYRQRFAALCDSLAALRTELIATLAPWQGSALYVYHPSWGYLTDLAGLRQIPLEEGGKEPGPQQLTAFVEQAQADRATILLVQQQFSSGTAQVFAHEIGAELISADPLAYDYAGNLRNIAAVLARHFEDQPSVEDR